MGRIKNFIGRLRGNSRKRTVRVFKNLGANPRPSERQVTRGEWKTNARSKRRVEKPGWEFNPTVYKPDGSTVTIPHERISELLEQGRIKSDSHGVYYFLPKKEKG